MPDVDDRWYRVDRSTGEKMQTARHGSGKRWSARWRDDAGRQRHKSFDRKVDADRFAAGIRADLSRGTYMAPDAGKVTLASYAAEWLAARTTDPATREKVERGLRRHVLPVLGDKELRVLASRPSLVQSWLGGAQSTLADSTIKVVFGHLSAVLSAAVDDGLIAKNPCSARSVRPPAPDRRKVVPWSPERVEQVSAALPGRWRAAGTVAAGCGLRQGEILGLGLDDVDFLGRMVRVRRQLKVVGNRLVFALPKGGRTRDVPLPSTVALQMSAHIAAFGPVDVTLPWKSPGGSPVTGALLLTSAAGGAVHRSVFNRAAWRPALAACGVPAGRENGMHALRHYYASVLLAGGVDIRTVAANLGHHDPGFTLRTYTHLMPSGEERTRQAIDRLFSAGGAPDVRHGSG